MACRWDSPINPANSFWGGGGEEDHRERLTPTLATGGSPRGMLGSSSQDDLLALPESQTIPWKHKESMGLGLKETMWSVVEMRCRGCRKYILLFLFAIQYSEGLWARTYLPETNTSILLNPVEQDPEDSRPSSWWLRRRHMLWSLSWYGA